MGWTLHLIKSFALLNISAARITTEVVPSPTSWSYNWDNSTMTLAAGCSTSNYFKIVAPKKVILWVFYHHLLLLHLQRRQLTFYLDLMGLKNFLQYLWLPIQRLLKFWLREGIIWIFNIKIKFISLFDLTSYPWYSFSENSYTCHFKYLNII